MGSGSASAQGCGPWNNWCMPQCGEWNNWCAAECGPWNGWCRAQCGGWNNWCRGSCGPWNGFCSVDAYNAPPFPPSYIPRPYPGPRYVKPGPGWGGGGYRGDGYRGDRGRGYGHWDDDWDRNHKDKKNQKDKNTKTIKIIRTTRTTRIRTTVQKRVTTRRSRARRTTTKRAPATIISRLAALKIKRPRISGAFFACYLMTVLFPASRGLFCGGPGPLPTCKLRQAQKSHEGKEELAHFFQRAQKRTKAERHLVPRQLANGIGNAV